MTKRSRLLATLLLGAVLAACVPTAQPTRTVTPAATGPEKVQITEATKGELQAVLQEQRSALASQDLKAYQATYDLERPAFRRCKQETFDTTGRGTAPAATGQVARVEPYLDTYVRAWVPEADRGLVRTYFRRVDGRWIQTEPKDSELGGEQKTTVDRIDIDYWGIDADVIDALGRGTVAARDAVIQNQLGEAKRLFGIRFYPTRSIAGLQACAAVGFHLAAQREDKYIRFFRYWFTPDGKDLSSLTISFIQHEGLHWAQDQFITGITARLDWWLREGWPDYIGKSRTEEYKRATICRTQTPTFKQLVDGPSTEADFPPEDVVRYYGFANTMVEYLYVQFGPDAYRQLLLAYVDRVEPHVTYPKVLQVTPEQFYAGWQAFAKKKYC